GALLTDGPRVLSFRPRWADLPIAIFTLCPIASSLTNDLGLYDGISTAVGEAFAWAVPYFLGRVYFRDWAAARDLALALFISGLVYVPFCVFEMRMTPQLHRMVYGYAPFVYFDMYRFGGYRPVVFLSSGLELGMWMTAASLMGVLLWATRSVRRVFGVPI